MIKESEVRFEAFCGSGPGGQYRNRHANCIRAIHDATGTVATATSERSMRQNKEAAFQALNAKIEAKISGVRAAQRKARHDAKPDATFGHAIRIYRVCGKDRVGRGERAVYLKVLNRGVVQRQLVEFVVGRGK